MIMEAAEHCLAGTLTPTALRKIWDEATTHEVENISMRQQCGSETHGLHPCEAHVGLVRGERPIWNPYISGPRASDEAFMAKIMIYPSQR